MQPCKDCSPVTAASAFSESSPAQLQFLAREKRHLLEIRFCQIFLFILLMAAWELSARLELIDDFIFSSPSRMIRCLIRLSSDGSLFLHTGVTLAETLISFLLVTFFSITIALLLWCSKRAAAILDPYLVILNSLPKSAMAPILIVWLGNHMRTIIITSISVAIFGAVLTLYTGFQSADPGKIKLISSLGGTRKDVLTKVLLPSSIPLFISTMKVNIGLCLIGVIIGEFLAAKEGLGYLIIYGSQVFELDLVIVSIFILCVISAVFYKGIAVLEKRIGP